MYCYAVLWSILCPIRALSERLLWSFVVVTFINTTTIDAFVTTMAPPWKDTFQYWPHIVVSDVRVNIRGICILREGFMVNCNGQCIIAWSLLVTFHGSDMITRVSIVSILTSHFNINVHCCGQKVLVLVWMCQIFQPISQVIFLLWMSTKVDNLVTQYLWKWTEQNLFKGKVHWTD